MGILDNAKEVAKAVQDIHNLELYQRVLSLHSDIIQIVEENNKLREENKNLARTLAFKEKMTFTAPFWFQEGDATPHCPACWEAKALPVHVVLQFDNNDHSTWGCPTCKHTYKIEKKDAPQPSAARRRRFGGGPWS
jgi:hypothetical protein